MGHSGPMMLTAVRRSRPAFAALPAGDKRSAQLRRWAAHRWEKDFIFETLVSLEPLCTTSVRLWL